MSGNQNCAHPTLENARGPIWADNVVNILLGKYTDNGVSTDVIPMNGFSFKHSPSSGNDGSSGSWSGKLDMIAPPNRLIDYELCAANYE